MGAAFRCSVHTEHVRRMQQLASPLAVETPTERSKAGGDPVLGVKGFFRENGVSGCAWGSSEGMRYCVGSQGAMCHSCASRNPEKNNWIPAFAGMTSKGDLGGTKTLDCCFRRNDMMFPSWIRLRGCRSSHQPFRCLFWGLVGPGYGVFRVGKVGSGVWANWRHWASISARLGTPGWIHKP
jgi:hypothetical protein